MSKNRIHKLAEKDIIPPMPKDHVDVFNWVHKDLKVFASVINENAAIMKGNTKNIKRLAIAGVFSGIAIWSMHKRVKTLEKKIEELEKKEK